MLKYSNELLRGVMSKALPLVKHGTEFIHKRKSGEPPKPRERDSPKKRAFIEWFEKYRHEINNEIDPYLPLGDLHLKVDEAYRVGNIKTKISRSVVGKCLPIIRKRNKPSL